MTHTYDWSKLSPGWLFEEDTKVLRHDEDWFRIATLESDLIPDDVYWQRAYVAARAQLAKCRIVDTEPAPLPPKTQLPEHPHFGCIATPGAKPRVIFPPGWDKPQPCPECGLRGLHICKDPVPFQPWRRGPLATWTLVNISCHDGRLTVVMRRGRGEVLIETGVDDEGIWERLGLKAVEVDKAKAKAAHADK